MVVDSCLQNPLGFNPVVPSMACSANRHHCSPVYFRGFPHRKRQSFNVTTESMPLKIPIRNAGSHHSWHKLKPFAKFCAELSTSVSQPDLLRFAGGQ